MRHDNGLAITYAIEHAHQALKEDGYVILKNAADTSLIGSLNADFDPLFDAVPFCVGGFYGERTKRFGSLLRRSPQAAELIEHPILYGLAERVLGPFCDTIQLNLGQAIEIHPGALQQFPHRDQDMWRGPIGKVEYLLNVLWPLTPFRSENGATLIWPRSHGEEAFNEVLNSSPIAAECEPNDAIAFLGSTLHGAGPNLTNMVRRGIIVSYCLGWLKPYENQWLVYPPEVARDFSPSLAALVGYQQHRPNLGNVEGQCPSILFNRPWSDAFAATDALRPDQNTAVAAFVAARE